MRTLRGRAPPTGPDLAPAQGVVEARVAFQQEKSGDNAGASPIDVPPLDDLRFLLGASTSLPLELDDLESQPGVPALGKFLHVSQSARIASAIQSGPQPGFGLHELHPSTEPTTFQLSVLPIMCLPVACLSTKVGRELAKSTISHYCGTYSAVCLD